MKHLLFYISLICCSCSAFAAEYTFSPSQTSELATLLKGGKLQPGDVVYLSDGTYTNFQVEFKGNGTNSQPITLKAKNEGKVILKGLISLKIGGTYLVVDGLVMKDGMAASGDIIAFKTSSSNLAYNCRLTNTVIDNCNNPDPKYSESTSNSERWVMLYGKNNRVDHCYFTNKTNGGVLMMVGLSEENSRDNNHSIDNNFFSHRPNFAPGNNAEIIRIGDSHTSQSSSKTLIENNYFLACDGEAEVISIKSCDNILRGNVFYESAGALVCRHGHRNIIETNAFIGNKKEKTAGVRVINEGHRIYNNFFQDLEGTGSYSALCVMTALFEKPTDLTDINKEPLNAYHRVKDVEICHNTFVNCANIDLGTKTTYTYSKTGSYLPGEKVAGTLLPECLIANNVVYNPSEKVLNLISGNVGLISYSNNVYRLSSNLKITGFEPKKMDFSKPETGYAKGIYVMTNASDDLLNPYNASGKVFEYVQSDISGQLRQTPKSIGAQQVTNVRRAFAVGKLAEAGVTWYEALEKDREYIEKTTDLWVGSPQGMTNTKDDIAPCDIKKTGEKQFEVSSGHAIRSVSVFNTSGQRMLRQMGNSYLAMVDCNNLSSGIYLFCVKMHIGTEYNQKIIV